MTGLELFGGDSCSLRWAEGGVVALSPTVMVTTMFTDLVDSTALASRLGPESAEALRRRYFGLLRDALQASGGSEVKGTGDGLHAVFPSVSAALAGAVGTEQAVELHNRCGGERLAVRVGISHGEAELGDDGDYYGSSVVEGARLCAAAAGGQILTSELVRTLAGSRGDHEFAPVGLLELRGLPKPVSTLEVSWAPVRNQVDLRTEVPFVGRAAERGLLEERWQRGGGGERRARVGRGRAGDRQDTTGPHIVSRHPRSERLVGRVS